MDKSNFREKIYKKIQASVKAIKMIFNAYEQDDIINLYVYDLIAYILNNQLNNKKMENIDIELENDILNLLRSKNTVDEINIKCVDLHKIINIIDNYSFSEDKVNVLQELFIYKRILIELDYELSSNDLSIDDRKELENECSNLNNHIEEIFEKLTRSIVKYKIKPQEAILNTFRVNNYIRTKYTDLDDKITKHNIYVDKDKNPSSKWLNRTQETKNHVELEKPIKPVKR